MSPNDIDFDFSETFRHGIRANVPSLKKSSSVRNQSLFDASFRVMGARLWNVVPPSLHSLMDPLQFKIKLAAFLNTFPDEPPTAGYVGTHSNPILDWSIAADTILPGCLGLPMTQ